MTSADAAARLAAAASAAEIAGRQEGVIHRSQLLKEGVSAGSIARWLRLSRLHEKYRGVYLMGHTAISPRGEAIAALFGAGKGARLSGWSVAAVCGLAPWPVEPDVTVARRTSQRRDGFRLRCVGSLESRDVTRIDGLPSTTVARMFLDLSDDTRIGDLADLLSEAEVKRLVTEAEVRDQLARAAGRRGVKQLGELLGDDDLRRSKQALARGYLALMRQTDLPPPSIEHPIGPFYIDAYWEDARLGVELQSWKYHGTPSRFRRDAKRTQYLESRGIAVFPVTWDDVFDAPMALVSRTAAAWAHGVARNGRLGS